MSLPFILYLGNKYIYDDGTLEGSISGYWHTDMVWVFTGFLTAFGVMLIAYEGHEGSKDDDASIVAGIAALGVAVFRTTPEGADLDFMGFMHAVSTLAFFVTLAFVTG